jgi:hypothetical protein
MMGASPHMSRNRLLDIKKGWKTNTDSKFKKLLFQKGHDNEEAARFLAELKLFESLPPVVGKLVIDGIELLASFDGLSFCNMPWENKTPNEVLMENIRNNFVEDKYIWQLEQQSLVSGSDLVLFSASDGSNENTLFMYYKSDPKKQKQLIAGWKQFLTDLKNHKLEAKTEPMIDSQQTFLPEIIVKITGNDVDSNVDGFFKKIQLLADREVGKPLECDQDFADKESLVKAIKKVEVETSRQIDEIYKNQGQIADFISTAKEAVALLRKIRLDGSKAIKDEKNRRKDEIIANAEKQMNEFKSRFNKQLAPHSTFGDFVEISANLNGAIMGKRNLTNIQDAVDSSVAGWKAKYEPFISRIVSNFKIIRNNDGGFEFLFNDWRSWVSGTPEAVLATTKQRVASHQKSEIARLEIERKKIRIEEERKARAKADAEAKRSTESLAKARAEFERKKIRIEEERKANEKIVEQAAIKAMQAVTDKVRAEALADAEALAKRSTEAKAEAEAKYVLKKDGTQYPVSVTFLIHWELYKQDSVQFKQGKLGRWVDSDGLLFKFNPEDLKRGMK